MKLILGVVALFVLQGSCINDECKNNDAYKITEAHLRNLADKYKRDLVLGGDILYSILYLEDISKIASRVAYGDVTVYLNHKDFKEDLKAWRKWLARHKCTLNMDQVSKTRQNLIQSKAWLGVKDHP
ncbi:MAG: hypothetical protein KDC53_23090 [Saprospiraceae bacterium]|nr:hypothetical protein [Saprospiraceae bacterium]